MLLMHFTLKIRTMLEACQQPLFDLLCVEKMCPWLHLMDSCNCFSFLTRLGSGARVPTQSAHEAVPAGQPALHGIGPAANSRPYMGGLTAFPASATSVATCFTPVVSGPFVSCLSFLSSLFLSCLFPKGSGPKALKEPDELVESDRAYTHIHELTNNGTQEQNVKELMF